MTQKTPPRRATVPSSDVTLTQKAPSPPIHPSNVEEEPQKKIKEYKVKEKSYHKPVHK